MSHPILLHFFQDMYQTWTSISSKFQPHQCAPRLVNFSGKTKCVSSVASNLWNKLPHKQFIPVLFAFKKGLEHHARSKEFDSGGIFLLGGGDILNQVNQQNRDTCLPKRCRWFPLPLVPYSNLQLIDMIKAIKNGNIVLIFYNSIEVLVKKLWRTVVTEFWMRWN